LAAVDARAGTHGGDENGNGYELATSTTAICQAAMTQTALPRTWKVVILQPLGRIAGTIRREKIASKITYPNGRAANRCSIAKSASAVIKAAPAQIARKPSKYLR
jgi:hypothetical protein